MQLLGVHVEPEFPVRDLVSECIARLVNLVIPSDDVIERWEEHARSDTTLGWAVLHWFAEDTDAKNGEAVGTPFQGLLVGPRVPRVEGCGWYLVLLEL